MKYTIEVTTENGQTILKRTNDGFNAMELLGLLNMAGREVIDQLRGGIKPDLVERIVMVDNRQECDQFNCDFHTGDGRCNYDGPIPPCQETKNVHNKN